METIRRGQLRFVLASTTISSNFETVGFWLNRSWEQIDQDFRKHLNYKRLEIPFSDGEGCIKENMLLPGIYYQRCQWHSKRNFRFLLYMKGMKNTQQKPFLDQIDKIPALALEGH